MIANVDKASRVAPFRNHYTLDQLERSGAISPQACLQPPSYWDVLPALLSLAMLQWLDFVRCWQFGRTRSGSNCHGLLCRGEDSMSSSKLDDRSEKQLPDHAHQLNCEG